MTEQIMVKLVWLDGRVELVDLLICVNSYLKKTDKGFVYILRYNGFEFEWHNHVWKQV